MFCFLIKFKLKLEDKVKFNTIIFFFKVGSINESKEDSLDKEENVMIQLYRKEMKGKNVNIILNVALFILFGRCLSSQ